MPLGDPNRTLAEAIARRQSELSFLAPQSFLMVIERLPTTTYFIQNITIPTASAGEAQFLNPHNPQTFLPGDTVDYVPLDVQYLVDSRLDSYRTIYEWMLGTNNPQEYQQFVDYTDDVKTGQADFQKLTSDIHVYATDPAHTPLALWTFKNAFPISIDGPQFDATQPDITYITTTVSFRYMYFTFQSLVDPVSTDTFLNTRRDKYTISIGPTDSNNTLGPLDISSTGQLITDLPVFINQTAWNAANTFEDITKHYADAYNNKVRLGDSDIVTGEANYVGNTLVIIRDQTDSINGLTSGETFELGGVKATVDVSNNL